MPQHAFLFLAIGFPPHSRHTLLNCEEVSMLKINNCFISLLFFLSIAPAIYAQDNGSTLDNLTGIIEAAKPHQPMHKQARLH